MLGRKWESMDLDAAWGGRFNVGGDEGGPDFNHFSFTHEGRR